MAPFQSQPQCKNRETLGRKNLKFFDTSRFQFLSSHCLSLHLISIFCLLFAFHTIAQETNSPITALSLKVLQQQLQAGSVSPELMQLGGLKRIDGFILDKKNQDVILFGTTTGSAPALQLDDLVIAFRSVWKNTEPPGCSIDPKEETLLTFRQFSQQFSQTTSIAHAEEILKDFPKIGAEPQAVRVMSVPRNTHFAQIMVAADYFTKRISNGTAITELKDFKSLFAIAIEKLKQDVAAGRNPQLTMYNRFWFTPGKVRFEPGDEIVRLAECEVQLLTEQQFFSTQGKLIGSGKESPLAQQFVQEFTNRYDEIAAVQPMYAELKSLFRFVAIAKGMKHIDAFATAGLNQGFLFDKYTVRPARVPETLPGITEIKKIVISNSNEQVFVWLVSYGGVEIDIQIDDTTWPNPKLLPQKPPSSKQKITYPKATVTSDTTARKKAAADLNKMKETILKSRPALDELKWTVAL
ncbi:MAG: DUF1598 domain-containing protein [bacterium]|nr:DUF1598 domain-containing protein [bacterium]